MNKYSTHNGKNIEFYNEGFSVRVRFSEGGVLPEELSGAWTDKYKAELDVIKYINKKEPVYVEARTENNTPIKIKNPKKNSTEEVYA